MYEEFEGFLERKPCPWRENLSFKKYIKRLFNKVRSNINFEFTTISSIVFSIVQEGVSLPETSNEVGVVCPRIYIMVMGIKLKSVLSCQTPTRQYADNTK